MNSISYSNGMRIGILVLSLFLTAESSAQVFQNGPGKPMTSTSAPAGQSSGRPVAPPAQSVQSISIQSVIQDKRNQLDKQKADLAEIEKALKSAKLKQAGVYAVTLPVAAVGAFFAYRGLFKALDARTFNDFGVANAAKLGGGVGALIGSLYYLDLTEEELKEMKKKVQKAQKEVADGEAALKGYEEALQKQLGK